MDWLIEVQCFPLYSILLAVGRTQVDYVSLDVEGSESSILMNVPWHLLDIKVSFTYKDILNELVSCFIFSINLMYKSNLYESCVDVNSGNYLQKRRRNKSPSQSSGETRI